MNLDIVQSLHCLGFLATDRWFSKPSSLIGIEVSSLFHNTPQFVYSFGDLFFLGNATPTLQFYPFLSMFAQEVSPRQSLPVRRGAPLW